MTAEKRVPLLFDETYREETKLSDGTAVVIRAIQPSDKAKLIEGYARLSPESRYRRFFTAKPSLSKRELEYLTEVDFIGHVALVIGVERDDGEEEGLGVARFIRLPGDPPTAEAAIAVVDEMQGKGVGTMLLQRLSDAALERGIKRFAAEFLAANDPVRPLFDHMFTDVEYKSDNEVVRATIPLAPIEPIEPNEHGTKPTSPLRLVLKRVAQGVIDARHSWHALI
jgi:GNAT superfamily N-acetyltransferase